MKTTSLFIRIMKPGFNLNTLFLFFFLLTGFANAQDFKTQVKFIDVTDQAMDAGITLSQIQKSDFDNLITKINATGLYTVVSDFISGKNTGNITIKSNSKSTVSDFESLLKQLGIPTVSYNGKLMSSQEIHSNYVPVNKSEIQKIERIK